MKMEREKGIITETETGRAQNEGKNKKGKKRTNLVQICVIVRVLPFAYGKLL
jgi:hypothetical protein